MPENHDRLTGFHLINKFTEPFLLTIFVMVVKLPLLSLLSFEEHECYKRTA